MGTNLLPGVVCATAVLGLSAAAQAEMIISELVDATLPGGLPKYVELTNIGSSVIDLTLYSIGNFNNGGLTLGGDKAHVLVCTGRRHRKRGSGSIGLDRRAAERASRRCRCEGSRLRHGVAFRSGSR